MYKRQMQNTIEKEERIKIAVLTEQNQKNRIEMCISDSYAVGKGTYLGHGSNLVKTTIALDMMRTMDGSAYTEYQKISKESSNDANVCSGRK